MSCLFVSATMSMWRPITRLPCSLAVVLLCCRTKYFKKLVLSIIGAILKPIFVVSCYLVVGLSVPMALVLFFLSGLGRFLQLVIMQPTQRHSGSRALPKALKKVTRRFEKKRRKALRPLRSSLGKHFLFWLRCAKIWLQCVRWTLFLAKLYFCHCALLLLAALAYGLFYGNGLSSGPSHCEGVFSYKSGASLTTDISSGLKGRGGGAGRCCISLRHIFLGQEELFLIRTALLLHE